MCGRRTAEVANQGFFGAGEKGTPFETRSLRPADSFRFGGVGEFDARQHREWVRGTPPAELSGASSPGERRGVANGGFGKLRDGLLGHDPQHRHRQIFGKNRECKSVIKKAPGSAPEFPDTAPTRGRGGGVRPRAGGRRLAARCASWSWTIDDPHVAQVG